MVDGERCGGVMTSTREERVEATEKKKTRRREIDRARKKAV